MSSDRIRLIAEPRQVFDWFEEICTIPRPSRKEEKIREYLLRFAKQYGLTAKSDVAGNVLISKPAKHGRENAPAVVLQTHMDMVCEKNSDTQFDFETQGIESYVENGWVKARGTTLGADCGIGIAAQLAVLVSEDIKHGPVECLITVDEETGLTGAFALQPGFFSGSILLNLDSEDEGEIFIGCAGGIDTVATMNYAQENIPAGHIALRISISGLLGGHSGDDIHKGRGNANKILNRFLYKASKEFEARLSVFDGGNLRNAIAREAYAIITIPAFLKEKVSSEFNIFSSEVEFEFEHTEPGLKLKLETTGTPDFVLDLQSQKMILNSIYACPHGVLEMSSRMEGMVETSTNLASVKFTEPDKVTITTSQRSEIESRKHYAAEMVESVFALAGFKVTHSEGYPGWTPNPDSEILKTTLTAYHRLFGNTPVVRSIHAGLECGLFLKKYPTLQMVSFGPTIRGAHSPDERLDILSTVKFWRLLKEVLEKV
jgi:dipeptidase D